MKVRRATTHDLPLIAGFIAEEAREAEGRKLDRGRLENGIGAALRDDSLAMYWALTDDEGHVCGCISVTKEWSDWNAGFYWWIQSVYITPEYRGFGGLGLLIDTVASAARAADCLELRLYVHPSNEAAIRAYEKVSFERSPYLMMCRVT